MKSSGGCAAMRSPEGLAESSATGTIATAVEASRRSLIGKSPTPWLDARMLASHVTGLDASAIIVYGDHRLAPRRRDELQSLTARRAVGEPIAYLIGFKEFCGMRIAVDRRVLIPRPETEELVQRVIDDWRGRHLQILDLGTGSGAIACALADMLPDSAITATDVSEPALEVARANVDGLALGERITLLHSDLFAALGDSTFDAIVANLPYVAQDDPELDPAVARYEPRIALDAGVDGLAVYRRMFSEAPAHLNAGGRIYCECGPATAPGVARLAAEAFPKEQTIVLADMSARDRIVIVA
ncbi:MAG TPA: peptide chain release factor N(5)-glutamine methyltransferase [Candidatus Binatus sp.]|nr:peptide chain release factor N(5)-glutamine methyltransferase [Candidatus Binatus sp.]